jgi:hypothetical protein
MTLNGGIGAPHTPLALFDAKLRGDSQLRRAPGFHPHAGQRRGLVPFGGSPVPKTSSVLVRSVRYGGPTATQRQAPEDLPAACEGHDQPAGVAGADPDPEPQHSPVTDADKTVARERREELSRSITGEDVSRLAEALRAAKRAHSASLAELRQADVGPVEDWAVWYAEYLLGVR